VSVLGNSLYTSARYRKKVERWWRSDGASQAGPGASAKGRLTGRMFLYL
jgi:hypothetical protein